MSDANTKPLTITVHADDKRRGIAQINMTIQVMIPFAPIVNPPSLSDIPSGWLGKFWTFESSKHLYAGGPIPLFYTIGGLPKGNYTHKHTPSAHICILSAHTCKQTHKHLQKHRRP